MADTTPNVLRSLGMPGGNFYVTGGTLRPDAPSYVERLADRELYEGLLRGEFCYVLTSRQMGKSSLMVRTVKRLRHEGVAVAVLDLTAIGQNLTTEQWYDGLVTRLGQQLGLEDELLDYCSAHPELGPLQRWINTIEKVVLERFTGKVVIFVDEIDIVRSLQFSTDEFFAGIRECYNRRSQSPVFSRLAFGLLGVATPTDLIRDTRTTPFNIGCRIELNDFTMAEAAPLARGLHSDETVANELLDRILYWTGGHPYLTQRLCRALSDALTTPRVDTTSGFTAPPFLPTTRTVDLLADKLFLSRQARDRDDNLIFVRERILRSEVDVAGLLYLYRKIHSGQLVPDDDANPLVSVLRLSGVTRASKGYLQVRNRIYWQVFDGNWVQNNLPEQEVRRQRKAGRRGMVTGFGVAIILLLGFLVLRPIITEWRQTRLAVQTIHGVQASYSQLTHYRDSFETTVEILGLGAVPLPVKGSGSILFEKPGHVSLSAKQELDVPFPDPEIRFVSDGTNGVVYVPAFHQYQLLDPEARDNPFSLPDEVAHQLGPMRVWPVYRLLLDPVAVERFAQSAHGFEYEGEEEIQGQAAVRLHWLHDPTALLDSLGLPKADALPAIPITAWVRASDKVVLQMRLDLSDWAKEIVGPTPNLPVTGLIVMEKHHSVETTPLPPSPERFSLKVPDSARAVQQLELPPPLFLSLASPKFQLSSLIRSRLPQAPRNLIDLTEHYNAALSQSWHSGVGNLTLEMLPPGLLQLGGAVFDVRGIVQLAGKELHRFRARAYPHQVSGITISQPCRRLHFLHGTGWRDREGTAIGSYIVHYADGTQETIPVVYGQDVRDWSSGGDPSTKLTRGTIVWTAYNGELRVRLFKSTWVNPRPEVEIRSLDFVSAMSSSAPFLIALTAEP
jgi:hypothetical protein